MYIDVTHLKALHLSEMEYVDLSLSLTWPKLIMSWIFYEASKFSILPTAYNIIALNVIFYSKKDRTFYIHVYISDMLWMCVNVCVERTIFRFSIRSMHLHELENLIDRHKLKDIPLGRAHSRTSCQAQIRNALPPLPLMFCDSSHSPHTHTHTHMQEDPEQWV